MVDEFKLYAEIKKAFSMEKGKIVLLIIDSDDVSKLKAEVFDDDEKCSEKTHQCFKQRIPYFYFDDLSLEFSFYYFRGRTFIKMETIKTNELLDFHFYGDDKPFDMEEVKKELKKLMKMLNSKVS